eukprot:SAG31_NODE_7019_length_1814_cov_22.676968_2_plen_68_part_00
MLLGRWSAVGVLGNRDGCSGFGLAPGSVLGVLLGREGRWDSNRDRLPSAVGEKRRLDLSCDLLDSRL